MKTCSSCGFAKDCYYPDDPSKVKCMITGNYRFRDHECEVVGKVDVETICLICGEGVPGEYRHGVVCEKCKAAVMKVREEMEREREFEIKRLNVAWKQVDVNQKVLDKICEPMENGCWNCYANDVNHDEVDNPCWNCKGDYSEWSPKEG